MPPRTTCPLHTGDAPTPTADTTATSYGNARAPRTTPASRYPPTRSSPSGTTGPTATTRRPSPVSLSAYPRLPNPNPASMILNQPQIEANQVPHAPHRRFPLRPSPVHSCEMHHQIPVPATDRVVLGQVVITTKPGWHLPLPQTPARNIRLIPNPRRMARGLPPGCASLC